LIEGLDLPAANQLAFRGLGDKAAALPSAHQRVDFLNQLVREHNVRSSVHGVDSRSLAKVRLAMPT
jgi:hypothetical protein